MNGLVRLDREEEFVQLAAAAIQRRHPAADWLGRHGKIGNTGLTDRALDAAVERLRAWLDGPPGQG